MESSRECRGISRDDGARLHPRARTSRDLGTSRRRGAIATGAPRFHGAALRLAAAAAAVLALARCDPYVEGNGVYFEEDRTGQFSASQIVGVHAEDGVLATVTAHAASQRVVVSGDANLVPHVRTEIQMETVHDALQPVLHVYVDLSGGYTFVNPPTIAVQVSDLVYALAKQNGNVDVTGAAAAIFTVRAESGGDVSLVGPNASDPDGFPGGDRINVYASDGNVDAHLYATTSATLAAYVELSQGAHAQIHADGPVSGTASGAGTWLDNTAGIGSCAGVTASGGAQVRP